MTDARIVLVKPGDVLFIGNLGNEMTAEDAGTLSSALTDLKQLLGLRHIFAFESDIDLAAVSDGAAQ